MSIETSPTKKQRKKKTEEKSRTESPRNYKRCNITCNRNIRRKGKREGNVITIWSNNGWEESKVINRYQTTDPGRLVNTKLHKWQKNQHLHISYSNCRKSKAEKILKEATGIKHLTFIRPRVRITDFSSDTMKARRQ